jgi:hypothetical protein
VTGGRGSSGVTLLELLAALLTSAVVLAGTHQVLLTTRRFGRVQSAMLEVHQSIRIASQILTAELRELDPSGGDIIAMGSDSISIRAMRGLAITCAPATSSGAIVVRDRLSFGYRAVDPSRDRALVLTGGAAASDDDDTWSDFGISSVSSGAQCDDGGAGTRITLVDAGGLVEAIAVGTPLRTYERVVYRLYADGSDAWWLGVRGWAGGSWAAISPVAGPFQRGIGLAFSYQDSLGSPVTEPARVVRVGFALRGVSSAAVERVRGIPAQYRDSLSGIVAPRNGRRGNAP